MSRVWNALAAIGVLSFLIAPARPAPLTPAAVAGSVFFNLSPPPPIDFSTFGTFSQTGPGGFVQFVASPVPAPFLSAEATVVDNFFARAVGTLVYEMEILGPPGDVGVSVQVSGGAAGSSETGEPFVGFAMRSIWSFQDLTAAQLLIDGEGINTITALAGEFNQTFAQTYNFSLTAGHIYRITTIADASARAGTTGTTVASAFIDPIFSFAPGVGPEYSFLLSDGIGNSGVPEPATTGLLALALLAIIRSRPRNGFSIR